MEVRLRLCSLVPSTSISHCPRRFSSACRRRILLPTRPFRCRPPRPSSPRFSSCSEAGAGEWSPDMVEVVGIGSRKDAIADFCVGSPFASSSRLSFWTIDSRDSAKVQLMQRTSSEDVILRSLELPLLTYPCPTTIILIATAGYGLDDVTALELLNAVRSSDGLAVAVLLKPFCFEGQRRQQEVADLIDKLQKNSHFYIVVETDSLLRTEEETLEEAIRIVNNAVLLVINMICVLMTDMQLKYLHIQHAEEKELRCSEILKLLEGYSNTEIGYGAGYDTKSSISQAVFNCPFLTSSLKGVKGIVVLMLASSREMNTSEISSCIHIFRRITKCDTQIISCGVHESGLEQGLIITTLLVLGSNQIRVPPREGLFSGLVRRFPFLFSFVGGTSKPADDRFHYDTSMDYFGSPDGNTTSSSYSGDDLENSDSCPEGLQNQMPKIKSGIEKIMENKETFLSDCKHDANSDDYYPIDEEENGLPGEQLNGGTFGPAFHIAQLWAKKRADLSGTSLKTDRSDVFNLLIGVKSPGQRPISHQSSKMVGSFRNFDGTPDACPDDQNFLSKIVSTGANLEAVASIYNTTLMFLKGNGSNLTEKEARLSVRAASMLEAERETERKWTPIVEMQYRGGTYRGRCQGGLPDGKGRLKLNDGSFYDGMWRCGKRSGPGTFCYNNGDVFQGTWRDDVMHGKGWFYFNNGDRWFANFWKGKASGEGRYYSRSGSVFFGEFCNGWRHGECLYIDSDGSRWSELWQEGILVSHSKLDFDGDVSNAAITNGD